MPSIKQQTFCGRKFTNKDISLIQDIIATCGGISRRELAHTVCELLEWKRPNGKLKARVGNALSFQRSNMIRARNILTLCKYSVSTPSSPVLVCSHSISMLRSPKQANMGHCQIFT